MDTDSHRMAALFPLGLGGLPVYLSHLQTLSRSNSLVADVSARRQLQKNYEFPRRYAESSTLLGNAHRLYRLQNYTNRQETLLCRSRRHRQRLYPTTTLRQTLCAPVPPRWLSSSNYPESIAEDSQVGVSALGALISALP